MFLKKTPKVHFHFLSDYYRTDIFGDEEFRLTLRVSMSENVYIFPLFLVIFNLIHYNTDTIILVIAI